MAPLIYFIGTVLPSSMSLRWQFSDLYVDSICTRLDRKHENKILFCTAVVSFALPLPIPPKIFNIFPSISPYCSLHSHLYPFYLPDKFFWYSEYRH